MNKQYKSKFNLGTVIALSVAFYLAYLILFGESLPQLSVASMISKSNELSLKQHLLVLGFVPIYIAAILFGAVMLGFYFGSMFQGWLTRLSKKKAALSSKS